MIYDQNFLMYKTRFSGDFCSVFSKSIVYLASCRVLNFFHLFKITEVYSAIFVMYLANPI